MNKIIKPKLPKDTEKWHYYLEPVYKRYKTIKEPEICDCCGSVVGHHIRRVGVGLIGYKVKRVKKEPLGIFYDKTFLESVKKVLLHKK